MKLTLLSLFVSITISAFGQDYLPLNTPKRFQNSVVTDDNNYYFYPIDTLTNSDTVSYAQYVRMSTWETSVTNPVACPVWGDPNLVIAADTTWMGRYVHYNTSTQEVMLENKLGQTLSFEFGLALGDSAVFYQSASEEYYLKYDQINEEVVYGVTDSVKTFLLSKYDLSGASLASSLNNFEVKLGKSLGLLSLIDCNNFPAIETGVELMGQLYPTIGSYNMTYDELYPFAPGDSLLVKGIAPPFVSYKLITISDRIETTDSVWIYLNFEGDVAGYNIEYPDIIAFRKGDNVSTTPDISVNGVDGYQLFNDSGDLCGTRKRHHSSYTTKYYCDLFHCFPDYDAVGDLFFTETYLSGLGQTYRQSETWGPTSNLAYASLIYSNVGGVVCGTPEALNIEEDELQVKISPNPVLDQIAIQTSFELERIQVLNSAGVVQLYEDSNGFDQQIDVSNLSQGMYFVLVQSSDGSMVSSKFIKQ